MTSALDAFAIEMVRIPASCATVQISRVLALNVIAEARAMQRRIGSPRKVMPCVSCGEPGAFSCDGGSCGASLCGQHVFRDGQHDLCPDCRKVGLR